jgi:two-component system CheB/CheR fusion protein
LRDLRVLVVDDDRGTCDAIAAMLGQVGAEVRLAESAAAAITAFEDFKPEVLVCDIAMPDEDGYTFIRKLRALGPPRGGDVPALALTALATEEDRRASLNAGYQLHVTKPVDVDRLIGAIGEVLALRKVPRSESAIAPIPGARA